MGYTRCQVETGRSSLVMTSLRPQWDRYPCSVWPGPNTRWTPLVFPKKVTPEGCLSFAGYEVPAGQPFLFSTFIFCRCVQQTQVVRLLWVDAVFNMSSQHPSPVSRTWVITQEWPLHKYRQAGPYKAVVTAAGPVCLLVCVRRSRKNIVKWPQAGCWCGCVWPKWRQHSGAMAKAFSGGTSPRPRSAAASREEAPEQADVPLAPHSLHRQPQGQAENMWRPWMSWETLRATTC